MSRRRTEKPLRRPIYLGNDARADKLDQLRERLGLASDSELVRRLIDEAPLKGRVAVPVSVLGSIRLPRRGVDLMGLLADLERELIHQALAEAKGNRTRAAALLGIGRWALLRKLRRYGLCGSATSDVRSGGGASS